MSVYRIFPSADATLYSYFPAKNTGLDEILEVSVKNSKNPSNYFVDPVPSTPFLYDDIRRSIVKFSDSDLEILKTFRTGSWKTFLGLYLANAENLTQPYIVEIKQVNDNWIMGTGKFADTPETRNGVSWFSTGSYTVASSSWTNPSYYITSGGGSWNDTYYSSQSFDYKSNKDIYSDVTSLTTAWFNSLSPNYGFLLKHSSSIENNPNSNVVLNYFSTDTHTIYPPFLEIKWDERVYNHGTLSIVNSSNTVVNISNNPYEIKSTTGKYVFRVTARDTYPQRVFTTSSLYTTNKALTSSSFWSIQDVKTEDIIVDFDTVYTKISCDPQGSFFNFYMNGLEPERYYKILIKVVLDSGESFVVDNDMIFKIVR
jgi:hypothetical protein